MTANGPEDGRLPLHARQMSPGWVLAALLGALLCAGGGWLLSTAVVLIGGPDDCEVPPCHGGPVTALYLLGGLFAGGVGPTATAAATGRATAGSPRLLPLAPVLCVSFAVGLLGAARTEGRTHVWALAAAAVLAALAVPSAIMARPYRARERAAYLAAVAAARRLDAHGVRTTGTVTAIESLGSAEEHTLRLRLTVRYPTADGTGHTRRFTRDYPVYDAPRTGGRVAVRYDPQDPATADLGDLLPDAAPPQGTRPPLTAELTRLAALHREGALDAAEFERAKAALLADPDRP
ncbi:DUF3592 domain-containing protein [Kitasatospora sp. NPDC056446]|uniref:DUF3592 domain-containing protein n=1 Tax=Kitasatospora sp. NPDC056446 TaxID=3345819 RepID=UPI00369C4BE6